MFRYRCPHCHARISTETLETARDAQREWRACPVCDGLIPLPAVPVDQPPGLDIVGEANAKRNRSAIAQIEA